MLIGASSGGVVAPTLTIGSTTNYNQNSAVFNATVNTTGNRNITLVEFQYSTSSSFASGNSAWLTASTNSTIAQGATSTATTCNASSLPAEGVAYYVRFRVTNSSGFVTTSSIGGSFTTYSLKAYQTFTGSGTWTNPRPTSGTSGLAITSIQDLFVVGGGAPGAAEDFSGGGGGGGAVTTSASISVGSSVVVTIGAGGSGYYGFGGTFVFATASSIAGTTTVTANPGGYAYGSGIGNRAGDSGNGNIGGLQNGYSGGGGKELFRFGASTEIAFGDWSSFVKGIQAALSAFSTHPREVEFKLQRQALAVRSLYSLDQERSSISMAWTCIANEFKLWRKVAGFI
jgi:hypothetical protein